MPQPADPGNAPQAESEHARLVESVRRLIEAVVTVQAPPAVLVAATDAIDRVIGELRPHVPSPPPPRYPTTMTASDPASLMPYDPIMGRLSPLAAPVRFTWQDPKAIGRVSFTKPYEGPPGCVHGGVIAAVFDQVFNVANVMRGVAGPTKKLEVRFRRPTPLGVAVAFEGWQERVEGREIHAAGRLLAGDEVCVEARGCFAQVPVERIMRLLDRDPSGDSTGGSR
jgi:acyl-coenzyme A thioesterase PaaI-like protein